MTQTEALKLALECAERCESIDGMYSWADTITAIKEALAQPKRDLKPRCFADFQLNHEYDRKCQWCAVETECKTGMAQPKQERCENCGEFGVCCQPKQEPVAWMRKDETCTDCFVWERTDEHTIPLYTTPPQRKPLTDEQIAHATAPVFMGGEPSLTGIARAIETAHGITKE